ncbi:unnamed protein product [Discosporangium mesarthrocarpum]
MASMSLRSPSNAEKVVASGGVKAIVRAMRMHPSAVALQRQAALCIRNIAARSPALREPILDEGCEGLLRRAGRHGGCVDEAYGALRDLHCEVVTMVRMGPDGEVHTSEDVFGEKKANFNTSMERTAGLMERVMDSAAAPSHDGYRL